MADVKKNLMKKGLDQKELARILAIPQNGENELNSYDVQQIDNGPEIRSRFYKVDLKFKNGSSKKIIIKEYPKKNLTKINPRYQKSPTLSNNEKHYLNILTKYNGFVPKFYDAKDYGEGIFFVMDDGGESLERIINEMLDDVYNRTKDAPQDEKEIIWSDAKNKVYNYLRRAIDVNLVNNKIITDHFSQEVEKYNLNPKDAFMHFDSFINFIFSKYSDEDGKLKWVRECHYEEVYKKCIDQEIVQYLEHPKANFENGKQDVLLLDFLASHILINKDLDVSINKYDGVKEELTKIIKGKGSKTYDGISIIDYDKVGYYPKTLPIAKLLNDPIIVRILPQDRRTDLVDHAFKANCVMEYGDSVNFEDPKIITFRSSFNEDYNITSRFALLHKLFYIASVHERLKSIAGKNNKEGYKNLLNEYESKNPWYKTNEFIIDCIDTMKNIPDPYGKFKLMNDGLNYIKENIILKEKPEE